MSQNNNPDGFNNLDVVSIKQLNDAKMQFVIPKLQRGYRWTEQQIVELLEDLNDFDFCKNKNDDDKYYCLQPIIIQKKDGKNYVIDGQQRLVTCLLFAKCLFEFKTNFDKYCNKSNISNLYEMYNISYELGDVDIDTLLQNENRNLTSKFINEGYLIIKEKINDYCSITSMAGSDPNEILGRIKFVYYELEDANTNEFDVFANVNVGKIQLSNAEKIKGLMLQNGNFEKNQSEELDSNKKMIVEEWSEIEHQLHNSSFFDFFVNDYHEKIRMNKIFDIFAKYIKKERNIEQENTFSIIETYLKAEHIKDIDTLREFWRRVKDIYYTLFEWYNDDIIYHYVGYLIYFRKDKYEDLIV